VRAVAILSLLCVYAHAADLRAQTVECAPQRVRDNRYWSYRIIDGRTCWYPGRPGKPKTELVWSRHSPSTGTTAPISEAERPGDVTVVPQAAVPSAAPATTEEAPPWQATMEDQLLAFTCCWPEPEPSLVLNKIQDRVTEMPRASPPVQPLWPLIFIPVIVIAVSVLIAKRRLT
jgi:hypothetical protein